MKNIKSTIKMDSVKHEAATYVGGYEGYTIYLSIENLCEKNIEVEIKEFYLVQDMERTFDYNLTGYLGKEGFILTFSKKSLARIWYKSSLNQGMIVQGDYVVVQIIDKTNKKIHFSRIDYDGEEWKQTYFDVRKIVM